MAPTRAQKLARKRRTAAQVALQHDEERHVATRAANRGEDPRKVVLDARTRMMAGRLKGDVTLPMYGDPCGRAIAARSRDVDEAIALWAIFDAMDKADAAFCRHVLGRARFAKTAKVEYLADALEVRADDKPDLRDDEAKARDAADSWARWRGHLAGLTRGERGIIRRVLRGLSDPMRDGKVTTEGVRFIRAMRELRNALNR